MGNSTSFDSITQISLSSPEATGEGAVVVGSAPVEV